MGVLEKLRISPESDQEYDEEFRDEIARDSDGVFGREPEEEFNPDHDPSPGHAPPRATARKKSPLSQVRNLDGPRVTKKMRDDAQAEIQSIVEVLALAWGWQAPPCGDALEAAAPAFSERLTRIVARNPRWLQRVRDGGLIADIVGCAGTLAPVVQVAVAYYSQPKEAAHGPGVEFRPEQFPVYDGSGFSRAG